jgi:uncharacterized protein (DUF433 family)
MTQMQIQLNRYIEITPNIRSGKPCIAGRRITVADIAIALLYFGFKTAPTKFKTKIIL